MCWIFWYVGKSARADEIILEWLQALEYRGYDSAGIAVHTGKEVDLYKSVGKVSELIALTGNSKAMTKKYTSGIGHTRWATHGVVNLENTHPHTDENKTVFIVHNGIIENFRELKTEIPDAVFYGSTDTEVIAKLFARIPGTTFIERVNKLINKLEWAYALLLINDSDPTEMVGVKFGSPLVLARGKHESFFLASDANAIVEHTNTVTYLEDGDIVHISQGKYSIQNRGVPVERPSSKLDTSKIHSEKGSSKHFMLKEIFEAPQVLTDVFHGRINFDDGIITKDTFRDIRDEEFERVEFIACGTSYHAGLLASYWIEELSDLDTGVTIASEFFSRPPRIPPTTLFVFISQSGETADSIEPLKYLKEHGAKTFGVVNVVGSTIARLADGGLFTRAGTEIGVASTKAFIGQIGALLIMSLFFSVQSGSDFRAYREILNDLENLSVLAHDVLDLSHKIKQISTDLAKYQHLFFLGRGACVAVAMESALKFKEITYLHAHGLALGELKHGSLALIDAKCPSVVFIPDDSNFKQNSSSIEEIRSRGGKVCAISQTPIANVDWNIILPQTNPIFYGFLAAIAGQLLAYHAADSLGRDIDKPRNLAKSVTVR